MDIIFFCSLKLFSSKMTYRTIQNFGGRKIWQIWWIVGESSIFSCPKFSFSKKLVIRIYLCGTHMCELHRGWCCWNILSLRPLGELSEKIPSSGISSANACIDKLLDLTSDDGNKQSRVARPWLFFLLFGGGKIFPPHTKEKNSSLATRD